MEITEVRVFPVNEEKLKAYATITFDDCFVVRDLKVIHGNSGLFVAMPSKKRKDGTFKDVAHPLNNEFRSKIEQKVLDAYEGERAESATPPPQKTSPPPPAAPEEPPPVQDTGEASSEPSKEAAEDEPGKASPEESGS